MPTAPQKGDLDLTHYVAIGNSLTAGYSNGTLYLSGQQNSYPAILAGQFAEAGGPTAFKQPYLLDDNGYPGLKTVLGYTIDCATGQNTLGPVTYTGTVNAANDNNISTDGPFNNIGIPGVRLIDFSIPFYANFNPYSKRFMSTAEKAGTLQAYAISQKPTFFSCWLGNNDVLGYASAGGMGSASGVGMSDITPLANFTTTYKALIDGLVANGSKGILITIPDITSTPAFSTIPYNGLVLARQGQADSLNAAYAPLGITFSVGANPFIIADATAPGGRRKMKEGELIILSAANNIKCNGWGSIIPLPDDYTLDLEEVGNINTATIAFNNVIRDNASRNNLALLDAYTYLKSIQPGIVWNGASYGATFVSGSLFSMDAVHLTPRGYALVANQIITSINQHYNSSIAQVDINNYDGTVYP